MDWSSGSLGINGQYFNFNWGDYRDTLAMAKLFRYFDVLSHKVEFSLASTAAATDSFNGGSIAFLPINYHVEGAYAVVPDGKRAVQELPGAVNIQYGANNKGQWYANPYKQTFSTGDAFPTAHLAGSIVAYFSDIGPAETIGSVTVYTNIMLWSREYNPTNPTMAEHFSGNSRPKLDYAEVDDSVTIVTKNDTSRSTIRARKG